MKTKLFFIAVITYVVFSFLFARTNGVNELSNFPSLAYAIGIIIFAFILLRLIGISENTVMVALSVLVLSSDFTYLLSRGAVELQLLFLDLAFLCTLEIGLKDKRKRLFAVSGVLLGMAALTDMAGIIWMALLLLYYLFTKKITSKELGIIAFGSLSVIFLYNIIFHSWGGNQFIYETKPIYWYGLYMVDSWRPFIFLLPLAITLSFKDKTNRLLFLWALAVIIPCSIIPSKAWWNIFPAMLPLVILAIRGLRNKPTIAVFALCIGSVPVWELQYATLERQILMFGLIFLGLLFLSWRKTRKGWIHISTTIATIMLLLFTFGVQERQALEYREKPVANTAPNCNNCGL